MFGLLITTVATITVASTMTSAVVATEIVSVYWQASGHGALCCESDSIEHLVESDT